MLRLKDLKQSRIKYEFLAWFSRVESFTKINQPWHEVKSLLLKTG